MKSMPKADVEVVADVVKPGEKSAHAVTLAAEKASERVEDDNGGDSPQHTGNRTEQAAPSARPPPYRPAPAPTKPGAACDGTVLAYE